jgi:glycosyltransferase involved in cell wall biosynthesis
MKIFGWAVDHHGVGNYRLGLPLWALRSFGGHDATAFSVLNTELPEDLDVFVGQIVSDVVRTEVWQGLARRPGRSFALVYELDDDVWTVPRSNPSYNYFADPEMRARIEDNLRVADAVTVTTDHLAEVVSPYNANVHVLPNCFDATILGHERPRGERLTVGWAGGSSHAHDFDAHCRDIAPFFRRNPDVDCHFFGTDYRAQVGRPDGRFTGWVGNLVDYIHALDFDIGIAPLAANAFNRSKSDLRFLEYASLAIPLVASDFGPYVDSIEHGVTGFTVRYPHEWRKYLTLLARDEALRTEMGLRAWAWAAGRTIQGNFPLWEQAYLSALGATAVPAVSA